MGDVLPPQSVAPAEAIEITEDGGVKKLIVREGVGEIPPLYSKCLGMSKNQQYFHLSVFIVHGVHHMSISQPNNRLPLPSFPHDIVHYTGILASNGELFINTRDESASSEPAKLVAGRGL